MGVIFQGFQKTIIDGNNVTKNCSSDLKIFANSQPSASNFKSFSQSLDQFFLMTSLGGITYAYGQNKILETKYHLFLETDLFNLDLLPPEYQKLLPRFGNSLNADSQGTLWLFAGFSQNSLNDIRAFDTKNGSWLPITVDISADTPAARYFHAR